MAIDFSSDDLGVATVTINRPDRMNALDRAHYAEFSRIWVEIRDDDRIRCVIVTGAGNRSFCAGADIKDAVGDTQDLHGLWRTQATPLLNRGLDLWKPVIAAVNGHCLGGGMTLLLATDLRVAAPDARFGVSEVKRGLVAGLGGTQRLIRQIAHAHAMELLLTGDAIDAATAERWGLVNRVVPAADLLPAARRYAETIAANAPLAVCATKELAYRARDASLAEGMRMEQLVNSLLQRNSADLAEGRAAFLEKRAPRFRGA